MMLDNYYWWFKAVLPEKLCDDIVEFGKSQGFERAWTGGDKTKKDENVYFQNKKRQSKIAWLMENWIYKEINPYIHQANEMAGWNFEWSHNEKCQFTRYDKGDFYGWHSDSYSKGYEKHQRGDILEGKIRKLSMTVSLSHPDEYEGGDLEFDFRNSKDYEFTNKDFTVCEEIRAKGSIIIFPSFVWHRVKPVTQGTRHSLVNWSCGQPWR